MPISVLSFEDYLDKANKAKDDKELFSIYMSAVKKHGLDRALFALITDHEQMDEKAGIGIIHSYPGDWMTHYFEAGLDKIDPVPIYGVSQVSAFSWDDIEKNIKLNRKQVEFMNMGEEAGLHNGVAICLRGGLNNVAGLSLAASEKKDSFDGRVDLITAYSNHFYYKYRELKQVKDIPPQNIYLTEKEREILTWAAIGKSNTDIGTILSMSKHTVDFHMRNILNKLDASSRISAVVKAISKGLIHP